MGVWTLLAAALLAVIPHPSPVATATPAVSPTLPATPRFRHYDISQGLPSSNVYTLVQDRRGMIWMGTRNGLVRYDGETFKVFRHVPGKAQSLSGDDVSSVLADSRGRLWAAGESGLNLLNAAHTGFRHFRHRPDDPTSLGSNSVLALAEGTHGSVWVGTYGAGLDHMTTPGHFEHLRHVPGKADSLASDNVLSLYSRQQGRLWIGTDRGLDVREADGTLHHVAFPALSKPPHVWGIDGDAHEVRVATSKGLFAVGSDHVAHRLAPGQLPAALVTSSVRDSHGALWVSTMDGVYLVEADGRSAHFPPQPLLPGGQPGRLVWQLTVDREGGLWLATQSGGVAYLSPDWRDFGHYAHRPDDPTSLAGSRILALAPDGQGGLWVGGVDGQLDRLDPATGAVLHRAKALGLAPASITSLANAGRHGLWVGYHNGLALFDGRRLYRVDNSRLGNGVRWMVADSDGTAYVAPPGKGVFRVDPVARRPIPLERGFTGENAGETHDLLMHDGLLWRASQAGLSHLSTDGRRLVPVPGVATGMIHSMAFAGHDLWLARPHGLEHYRLHDGKATLLGRVQADRGWPGIEVTTMRVDRRGRVWLFAGSGLWCYEPSTGVFRRFGTEDGLPSPEFTSRQLVRGPHGALFAGTLGGVVGFHPAAERDHPRPPPLILTAARVHRDGHDIELPLASHALHLRWDDRDLRVSAQALSYIDPKSNRYRFHLEGFDTEWVDTGHRGLREFAGLGSGSYQLEVQAAGPSGAWSRLATPLRLRIDAPPWATWWAWLAYVLAGLLLIGLVLLAWRRRLEHGHRLQLADQRRQLAETASQAKTRFLATLSHEIRTPMTGVLGMAELLLGANLAVREQRWAAAIHASGELLLKLVNDALDMARIESGHLQLEPAAFDVRKLVAETRALLAGQVAQRPLQLHADTAQAVPGHLLGDHLRIQQILLNLANNAIKFTERGTVAIGADYVDGELLLTVSDTGPGISAADRERLFGRYEQADTPQRHSGSGLGLAICRELVALMEGTIALDSTPGEGSRFRVALPLPLPSAVLPAPPTRAEDHVPQPRATHALRLLLVEDNATVAEVIRGLLQSRGHQVTHASQGLEALVELRQADYDAVLLDLDLPALDGYQVAAMIRRDEAPGTHLPIVAITARAGGNEAERALAAGMDAFLRKPLRGQELAATLHAVILAPPAP